MSKNVRRWISRVLATIGLFIVVVVTIPISKLLVEPLRLEAQIKAAEAIVVPGGGAFEDGLPSISSLARAVYGFSLFRAGYTPRLLLAGGQASPEFGREGLTMKKLLQDLGASVKALETEDRSSRTYSNAQESARILKKQGATHILLVTHPNHMLRARWTFEKAGCTVYPAPIPWDRLSEKTLRPSIGRIVLLHNVLYEYAALLLYWWRGWL
ncbi:MAG: YdcF family protein [Deltaproteobacteria bacterium]|nr:YdcF family protein [Deltaproteobacteria bacterium]